MYRSRLFMLRYFISESVLCVLAMHYLDLIFAFSVNIADAIIICLKLTLLLSVVFLNRIGRRVIISRVLLVLYIRLTD